MSLTCISVLFSTLLLISGCTGPVIPEGCEKYLSTVQLEWEFRSNLVVRPFLSDSFPLGPSFSIQPFLDRENNVSLEIDVLNKHYSIGHKKGYLKFEFADSDNCLIFYPDSVIERSPTNYVAVMYRGVNSKKFEVIEKTIPKKIEYHIDDTIVYSSSSNVDYFVEVLNCLEINSLKYWIVYKSLLQ